MAPSPFDFDFSRDCLRAGRPNFDSY